MPVEYRKDGDQLVWVRNPFTGTITYFTHVHKKSSGFVRHVQDALLRSSTPCIHSQRYSNRAFARFSLAVFGWVFCAQNWQRRS